jgi:phosphoserine phosphatase
MQSIPPVEPGALLHVFDMDGTLLMGAATVEISRYLGRLADGMAIEEAWLRGAIDNLAFWNRALEIWDGITEEQIDGAFEAAVWIKGIREVFRDIHDRGERSIVISQSPHFFVKRLERWGAHATFGSDLRLGEKLREDPTLQPKDKQLITQHVLGQWGVSAGNCLAYGDSSSDIDLFRWLPNTVGVNAKGPLADLAVKAYEGNDLRKAYALGRSLVDENEKAGTPRSESVVNTSKVLTETALRQNEGKGDV